jgi:hypothetical protein
MQLFILFSIPLFFGHLIHQNRDNLQDLIPVRKRAVGGILWAGLALLVLLILSLLVEYRVSWLSLYLYAGLMHYLLPLVFVVFAGNRYLEDYRKEGDRGLLLFQSQLAGFFSFYNIGVYFIFISDADQINLLFIPLFHIFLLVIASRALWRAIRFEIQWKVIMFAMFALVCLALPAVQMLYGLLIQFWAWVLALALLTISVLFDRFFTRLELDIQYRLALETRFKPLMRVFFRPRRQA